MAWYDDIGGFLSDTAGKIFTTDNVVNALGTYATIGAANKKSDEASQLQQDKFNQELDILKLKHEFDKEMLALKGAGGGSGGGGSSVGQQIASAERLAKFNAMLKASENGMGQSAQNANLTVQALRNLIDASQRPLVK